MLPQSAHEYHRPWLWVSRSRLRAMDTLSRAMEVALEMMTCQKTLKLRYISSFSLSVS